MKRTRVYGTVVNDGVRHEASGIIGGTFARTKNGWDTYTVCGKYLGLEVETDNQLYATCLRCIGRRRPGSVLRGITTDVTYIDETQDIDVAPLGRRPRRSLARTS